MNFDLFFDELGINAPNKCFESVLQNTISEYQSSGVHFLCDEYIGYVNSFGDCLSNFLSEIKNAAQVLRCNQKLALYTLFLHRAIEHRSLFIEHINSFAFPEGSDEAQMLIPFIALLPEIPKLYDKLKRRMVPEDIIATTLRQFEDCIYLTRERTGKLGYLKRYFDHMQLYIDEKILNIGRLRFEMVRELESDILVLRNSHGKIAVLFDGAQINSAGRLCGTPPDGENQSVFSPKAEETETAFYGFCAKDNGNCTSFRREYPKSIWQPALKKGDSVLSVHIPNKGALTKEACQASFCRAQAIYSACYPEFAWKAFHCHSWMLDPQLQDFLPKSSNILAFQRNFTLYAGETQGQDVFNFVFKLKFKTYQDLPEDTSLQRALKKHYLCGKYLYEYEGLFFPK